MLAETILDSNTDPKCDGVVFMQVKEETELLRQACLGDAKARLQLVKDYLDLVVELAAGYSAETGMPFPEMVQVGTAAVMKAADDFHSSQEIEFSDHLAFHITRAIEEISYV